MDAYTASVNAFTRLADVLHSQVATQVASWLKPQVERSLTLVATRELPGSALLEKKEAVYQIHKTASRLDPLSGDVLRPKILEAANAIDRRFYTDVLQTLPEALQGGDPEKLKDIQGALFWVSQNGLLEDLQQVLDRLPREIPEHLEYLRQFILERRNLLSREPREVIAVREVLAPDTPGRFLVSTRAGRPLDPHVMQDIREKLMEWGADETLSTETVNPAEGEDSQVLVLRNTFAERLQENFGVLVEPDAKLYLQGERTRDRGLRLRLVNRQGDRLGRVPVRLVLQDQATGDRREYVSPASHNGHFFYPLGNEKLVSVEVRPRGSYWSKRFLSQAENGDEEEVVLDQFPQPISELCWWRELVRFSGQGKGVNIALIDSGVEPHPALKEPLGGICVKDLGNASWDTDDLGHGTHIAGILCGADPSGGFRGIAPEAGLWVIRVCAGPKGEFHASHLIEAMRKAVIDYGVDIINISASTATHLAVLQQELRETVDRGVLVVAAVGNQGRGEVCYPARFEDAVGVSACGKQGSYPSDSTHVIAESEHLAEDFYFAKFSNSGPGVDVCAPGVAIVSTVLDGLFGSMDGTSMACPMVAGAAACLLSESEELRGMQGRDRVQALKAKLFQSCRKMASWTDLHQGVGLLHP